MYFGNPKRSGDPLNIRAFSMRAVGEPMVEGWRAETPGPGEVLVRVAGCGVCHTDLGFCFDGVPTRHPLPLTLGHEISGRVVALGDGVERAWLDQAVIVPAVIPCGECAACRDGRGAVCPAQVFPGNDVHGGFATHVRVPARGLCLVPDLGGDASGPERLDLAKLAVVADAVTTPYQAIVRSGLGPGDLAVFVGVGGVGGFGVQIAKAFGAWVAALDVEQGRLDRAAEHGADLTLRVDELGFKQVKSALRTFATEREVPTWRRRIFETSGTPTGQTTAFGLLEPGGYLSVVGFTPERVELRLSNLMAYDATVQGNWGCLPEHYPPALDLVLSGRVRLAPFVEQRPLSTINDTFEDVRQHRVARRVVLVPE
jgi:6-hydroxycyclohex-1-ene-1-carbonyl-CoA dehydrogenase